MMKKSSHNPKRIPARCLAIVALLLGQALIGQLGPCHAVEIEGFTEPYQSVNVASPEQGIVKEISVKVGEFVTTGQAVAQLDDELHLIMLETARQRKSALGRLESAEAELRLRTTRYEKLIALRESGFGRKEEVDRAATDLEIAEAELKAVRDDLADKHWQYQKIDAELKRRVIRSPLDGVVVSRLKEPGEFVAPNEPNLLTVVQLDPLIAKFSMKQTLARHIHVGDEVKVTIESAGRVVTGIVDVVAPVIDAQSGTIKIKVRIDNPLQQYLSGERCTMNIRVGDQPSNAISDAEQRKVANRS